MSKFSVLPLALHLPASQTMHGERPSATMHALLLAQATTSRSFAQPARSPLIVKSSPIMAATIGAEDTTLVSKQAGAQASSSGVNIGVVEQQGSEQRKVQPAQVVLIKTKVVSQDPVKPKGAPHLCASLLGAVVGRKEPRQHQRVIVGSGMRKVRRGGARQLSRAAQDVHIRHAALLRGGVALGRRRGRHPSSKRSAARGGSACVRLTSA